MSVDYGDEHYIREHAGNLKKKLEKLERENAKLREGIDAHREHAASDDCIVCESCAAAMLDLWALTNDA